MTEYRQMMVSALGGVCSSCGDKDNLCLHHIDQRIMKKVREIQAILQEPDVQSSGGTKA